jgi:DNA repair exonuclease SbcCD ATPase subunit
VDVRNATLNEQDEIFQAAEEVRQRFNILKSDLENYRRKCADLEQELQEINGFLELQPYIADRLEKLSLKVFVERLRDVEENLSYALQDVLGQDLKVKSDVDVKHGKIWIQFYVERDGHREDILRGQGGSVCNILSVGLRLIALSQLDEKHHRRFVVLDEQDCWLRPDLVPRFMRIIHRIAEKLSYQVLVISHHDIDLFRDYADRIYRLVVDDGSGSVRIQQIF